MARFLLVGGFLGAGKTTAIGQLVKHYQEQGLKVGVVTNDQADGLVDTGNLRGQGVTVEEVSGACFCCKFNDLTDKLERLEANQRPDIFLAEPVGSCTDLVATVVEPLRAIYAGQLQVGPYSVLFKPSHGKRVLAGQNSGFSEKAAYIFRKQLEEADILCINRADELTTDEIETLTSLIAHAAPKRPIVPISARTGLGFGLWMEHLANDQAGPGHILDIDYDIYAEGEAELGWMNATLQLNRSAPVSLNQTTLAVVEFLAGLSDGEIAHLKAIGQTDSGYAVANIVHSGAKPTLSIASGQDTSEIELVINARIATSPEDLMERLGKTITFLTAQGWNVRQESVRSFRPGRPVPTHRYAAAR